jgi:hypothetical protein
VPGNCCTQHASNEMILDHAIPASTINRLYTCMLTNVSLGTWHGSCYSQHASNEIILDHAIPTSTINRLHANSIGNPISCTNLNEAVNCIVSAFVRQFVRKIVCVYGLLRVAVDTRLVPKRAISYFLSNQLFLVLWFIWY